MMEVAMKKCLPLTACCLVSLFGIAACSCGETGNEGAEDAAEDPGEAEMEALDTADVQEDRGDDGTDIVDGMDVPGDEVAETDLVDISGDVVSDLSPEEAPEESVEAADILETIDGTGEEGEADAQDEDVADVIDAIDAIDAAEEEGEEEAEDDAGEDELDAAEEGDLECIVGVTGDACSSAGQCACVPSLARQCLTTLSGYVYFPGGYCSAQCTSTSECGPGANCAEITTGTRLCLKLCTSTSQCRMAEGYGCTTIPMSSDTGTYCWPPSGSESE
jgi:hypothetical protein